MKTLELKYNNVNTVVMQNPEDELCRVTFRQTFNNNESMIMFTPTEIESILAESTNANTGIVESVIDTNIKTKFTKTNEGKSIVLIQGENKIAIKTEDLKKIGNWMTKYTVEAIDHGLENDILRILNR